MERGLTRNQIMSELTRSAHGKLSAYVPVGIKAAAQEPEFYSHLIAWDRENGQIRDSKVALPVISLSEKSFPSDLIENSLAHLALLDPRDLVRAVDFAKSVKTEGRGVKLRGLVTDYLRAREDNWSWWERTAVQHKASLKRLYALFHVKPKALADEILFKGNAPRGTIFAAIKGLSDMGPKEAAGTILERRIPFLVAMGALGKKAEEPDLVMALIDRMSPTELVTNSKMLEKLGIKENPSLRAAYEQGLKRVAKSKKTSLKATKAVESVKDAGLKEKLRGVQNKQIEALGGVEGDWLVLGDKSGSMSVAIETARQIA